MRPRQRIINASKAQTNRRRVQFSNDRVEDRKFNNEVVNDRGENRTSETVAYRSKSD